MILDNNLLFDTASSLAISPGTQASANTIDLLNARDMGAGTEDGAPLKLLVQVSTAFATAAGGTLAVAVQGSTNNSTFTTYATSDAIAAASLTAGARVLDMDLPRPAPGAALPRYLRLLYTVGTGAMSAGAVTAALALTRGDNVYYPPGVTVVN